MSPTADTDRTINFKIEKGHFDTIFAQCRNRSPQLTSKCPFLRLKGKQNLIGMAW